MNVIFKTVDKKFKAIFEDFPEPYTNRLDIGCSGEVDILDDRNSYVRKCGHI